MRPGRMLYHVYYAPLGFFGRCRREGAVTLVDLMALVPENVEPITLPRDHRALGGRPNRVRQEKVAAEIHCEMGPQFI